MEIHNSSYKNSFGAKRVLIAEKYIPTKKTMYSLDIFKLNPDTDKDFAKQIYNFGTHNKYNKTMSKTMQNFFEGFINTCSSPVRDRNFYIAIKNNEVIAGGYATNANPINNGFRIMTEFKTQLTSADKDILILNAINHANETKAELLVDFDFINPNSFCSYDKKQMTKLQKSILERNKTTTITVPQNETEWDLGKFLGIKTI